VIIARGRIVADATPEELKRRSDWHNAVRITVNANLEPRLGQLLGGLETVREVRVLGKVNGVANLLVVPRDGAPIVSQVGERIRAAGAEVDEIAVEQGHLDDVFRDLTTAVH
jgi:ABC-2 type transport system ATP-binding protein